METKKVDDYTLEVIKPVTITYPSVSFDRGYLESQRKSIVTHLEEYTKAREAEIAEIDGYLKEMDKLGIKVRPVEDPNLIEELRDDYVKRD